MSATWEELDNALAWFRSAPARWLQSAKQDLSAAAEWIWVVLQGDFAEEQTTAQVVTGTVISMIPLVDQVCDVRDLIANCKKIHEDRTNQWAWVALVLTLIGLFPTLGSLVKGCLKILFAYGRKAVFNAGRAALDSDLWQATRPYVEHGIAKLNDHLARPEVRRALSALRIDQPYRYLAQQTRKVAAQLQVSQLTAVMDSALSPARQLLGMVQRWGGSDLARHAQQTLQMLDEVRRKADRALAQAVQPVQNWLNRLAQRLDVEHRLNYRAQTNAVNPHHFHRFSLDAEIEALRKSRPKWVTVGKKAKYTPLQEAPEVPLGHFDIGKKAPGLLREAFQTFHTVRPDVLPPGTVLYRVLDPKSNDNSLCWMTREEFAKLLSKPEWRQRFAVWRHWNHNGEFVTYTVPPGEGLRVWRGTTASQELKDRNGTPVKADDQGNLFWLDGGAEQIVVNP
ncbi:hypothetical protein, partial [Caldimonas taiwanensis]|uniref:hypothetical protein n=1 Tax=Caldimonas taiwanensis TaxID=307483 RepID=UPI0007846550